MNNTNNFSNYSFINLGNLDIFPDISIVILYARFMSNFVSKWTMETHSHPFYELHLPMHGSCSIIIKKTENITLSTGKCLLIHPNTEHQFTDFSDDFFRLSITFDIKLDNKNVLVKNTRIFEDSGKRTIQLLKLISTEYENQNFGYINVVSLHIKNLIIEFLRSHQNILFNTRKNFSSKDNVCNMAINFIKNNISMGVNAQNVADYVNFSTRQLSRIFAQNLNMTVSEFIKSEKVFQVCEYLKKTDLSLREIALLAGFSDEYVLNKAFKKKIGITPGKYRSNLRNQS